MASHSHGAHHPPGSPPTPDKAPAFIGLVVAAVFLFTTVVVIVKWTNSHYAAEAHESAPAAEAPR